MLVVESIYDLINYPLKTSRSYLSADEVAALTAETKAFKAALNEVTEKYVAIKNSYKYFDREEFFVIILEVCEYI